MKLIQLRDEYGDEICLFSTERTDDNIESDIREAHELGMNDEEMLKSTLDIMEEVLENKEIYRVYINEEIIL